MYINEKYFTSLILSSGSIKCASKTTSLEIKGVGHIIGKLSNGVEITQYNVFYFPDINEKLISVRKIETANYAVAFNNETFLIKKRGNKFCFCERDSNGEYVSDFVNVCESVPP